MTFTYFDYVTAFVATLIAMGVLMLIVLLNVKQNIGTIHEIRAFRTLCISELVLMVCESLYMINSYQAYAHTTMHLPNAILFLINGIDLICNTVNLFAMFLFGLLKANLNLHKTWIKVALWAPLVFDVLIVLTSGFTHAIFWITESGAYMRGPLYNIHLICIYIYAMAIIVYLYLWYKEDEQSHFMIRNLIDFLVLALVGGSLQIFVKNAPFAALFTSLGIIYIFIKIQSTGINRDPLTGLNNRYKLAHHFEKLFAHAFRDPFSIIMIDVDHFKRINDQYGHVCGDEALICIGDALKNIGDQRPTLFIARYGGDEFLLTISDRECDSQSVIQEVNEEVKRLNKVRDLPFTISLSFGTSYVDTDSMNSTQAIAQADHELYLDKERGRVHGS